MKRSLHWSNVIHNDLPANLPHLHPICPQSATPEFYSPASVTEYKPQPGTPSLPVCFQLDARFSRAVFWTGFLLLTQHVSDLSVSPLPWLSPPFLSERGSHCPQPSAGALPVNWVAAPPALPQHPVIFIITQRYFNLVRSNYEPEISH